MCKWGANVNSWPWTVYRIGFSRPTRPPNLQTAGVGLTIPALKLQTNGPIDRRKSRQCAFMNTLAGYEVMRWTIVQLNLIETRHTLANKGSLVKIARISCCRFNWKESSLSLLRNLSNVLWKFDGIASISWISPLRYYDTSAAPHLTQTPTIANNRAEYIIKKVYK